MADKVLSEGHFRVDRRRALQKIERFQLEDPRRYVVELLAAAVCSGAGRVQIDNDADDFVIRWVGDTTVEPPSRDELEALFDAVFGNAVERRPATLQHLGLGVLGAHGLRPRWLHVDTGPWRLPIDDPAETQATPREPEEDDFDVRVSVRERLSVHVVSEALSLLWQRPAETRLVAGAARWCPIEVRINGSVVPGAQVGSTRLKVVHAEGLTLGLARHGSVDIVRNGVVVGHRDVRIGGWRVVGWVRDDALRLNASRSAVVEDDAFAACMERLDVAIDGWLRESAPADDLGKAAVQRLLSRGAELGVLAERRVLVDDRKRAWSVSELRQMDPPPGYCRQSELSDPDWNITVFPARELALLRLVMPDVADVTETLRSRARARRRRARAPKAADFGSDRHQRRFRSEDGRTQGAVRLPGVGQGTAGRIHIEPRVGGIPVLPIDHPWKGVAVDVVVDDPDLPTDPGFRHVVPRGRWDVVLSLILSEAHELVVRRIVSACFSRDEVLRLRGLHWLAGTIAQVGLDGLDARLREAALLPSASGTLVRIDDVGGFFVVGHVPLEAPRELLDDVLVVPPGDVASWCTWLGLLDGTEVLAARVERHRRTSGRPREPVLVPRPDDVVPLSAFRGEVGVRKPVRKDAHVHWHGRKARIHVQREGFRVVTLQRDLGLPDVVAIVEGDFDVSAAHDALTQSAEPIVSAVQEAVDRLARSLWSGPLPDAPVLRWLAHGEGWRDAALRDRPVARAVSGELLTLRQLRKRRETLFVVEEAPEPHLPGLGDLVVLEPELRPLLEAACPARVEDGGERVEASRAAWRAYRSSRAILVALPDARVATTVEGEGWKARLYLPQSGALQSRIQVRWQMRELCAVRGGLGASAVVDGLLPNHDLSGTTRPEVIDVVRRRCTKALGGLIDAAIADYTPDERTFWLQVWARLRDTGSEHARRLQQLPLVSRVHGGAPITLGELFAAASGGAPVHVVAARFPEGPADHAWYVRAPKWLRGALEDLLGRALPEGDVALRDHQDGMRRRRRLTPRTATVSRGVIVRASIAEESVSGEVAVTTLGEGLTIVPLVDGLPLASIERPWPVPARAVVEGPAIRADRRFEHVVDDTFVDVVEGALIGLLPELAEAVPSVAMRWVLAREDAPDLPVFPVLGGARISRRVLEQRVVDGALGVVSGDHAPLPREPQPVVARGSLRGLLGGRFRLVDLERLWNPPVRQRPPVIEVQSIEKGWVGIPTDPSAEGVILEVEGVEAGTLVLDTPLPLCGRMTAADAAPDALWDRVSAPGTEARLRSLAGKWLEERVKRVDLHRELLRTALLRGGALEELPLFTDSEGQHDTLEAVLASSPVRAVGPLTVGRPGPGASRVWRLTGSERAWLSERTEVVDATRALRQEDAGYQRRLASPYTKTVPPGAVVLQDVVDGAEIVVWLGPQPLVTLVEGVFVGPLDVGLPGLAGWADGAFPTDAAFREADVPEAVLSGVRALARELMLDVRSQGPEITEAPVLSLPEGPAVDAVLRRARTLLDPALHGRLTPFAVPGWAGPDEPVVDVAAWAAASEAAAGPDPEAELAVLEAFIAGIVAFRGR